MNFQFFYFSLRNLYCILLPIFKSRNDKWFYKLIHIHISYFFQIFLSYLTLIVQLYLLLFYLYHRNLIHYYQDFEQNLYFQLHFNFNFIIRYLIFLNNLRLIYYNHINHLTPLLINHFQTHNFLKIIKDLLLFLKY